jgi:formylglycine-generating enzyme required for sulfatase activity
MYVGKMLQLMLNGPARDYLQKQNGNLLPGLAKQEPFIPGVIYLRPEGKWMANIFEGQFPYNDVASDGFKGAAPVKKFPPNGYGLYDIAGNVWEWCSDWYRPDYYKTLSDKGLAKNPQGPKDSYDPAEPGQPKKIQRGGSYLCTDQYCTRYMVGTRGKGRMEISYQSCRAFVVVKDLSKGTKVMASK